MEYTKGPWMSHYRMNDIAIVTMDKHVAWIADTDKEAQTNARLISASPDLYEALNALVRAYNNMSVPELCKQHELWQAAENALIKAEGKEV